MIDQQSEHGKVRLSKYRKKMNFNKLVITISLVGLICIKLFVETGSIAKTLSAIFIFGFFGGIIASFFIKCEYCGTGWYNFPSGSFRENFPFNKNENTSFDVDDIPDRCPKCGAIYE